VTSAEDAAAIAAFRGEYGDRPVAPVAVVIAAYNEERGIGAVLDRIPAEVCGLATDTLVVVDGGTDATANVARSHGVLVCQLPVNRGQGAALRVGYRLAREGGARYIATLDADGQYDPRELPLVIEPLVRGTADFVSGSRRLGSSSSPDPLRRAGVVVYSRVISLLGGTRITDPAFGLRAMRAELTGDVTLAQPQYQAAELLLGAMLRGYRVAEVPTTMTARAAGSTKKGGNLRYGWRFLKVIVRTWSREQARRWRPRRRSFRTPRT
jgi:glycosyltransferase involved in cell wall biosynthesis